LAGVLVVSDGQSNSGEDAPQDRRRRPVATAL